MQTLIKSWWLLALCGVLDAVISVINFDHAGNGIHTKGPVMQMGMLALAAGACTIAAGIWSSKKGRSWLLVLNGLALGALGLILTGIFDSRIQFRTIALLIVVMATSIGIYELATARALRRQRHVADEWLLGAAGLASVGFASVFFAFLFRWIKMELGPSQTVLWLASYFAFSAICMLGLGLRLHSLRAAIHRMARSAYAQQPATGPTILKGRSTWNPISSRAALHWRWADRSRSRQAPV